MFRLKGLVVPTLFKKKKINKDIRELAKILRIEEMLRIDF